MRLKNKSILYIKYIVFQKMTVLEEHKKYHKNGKRHKRNIIEKTPKNITVITKHLLKK